MTAPRAAAIPWIDPEAAFQSLARRSGVFWLDSSMERPTDGRYSAIGCEPCRVFTAWPERWELREGAAVVRSGSGDPLGELDALIALHALPAIEEADLPFQGGAVGWFAYDLGRRFERVEGTAVSERDVPDIRLAWHDAAVVWDHRLRRCWIVGAPWRRPAAEAIADLRSLLRDPIAEATPPVPPEGNVAVDCDVTRAAYLERVDDARAAIARGEIYQVNLARRFRAPLREPPERVYRRLRGLNPAPFAFYQDAGEHVVAGSSPERFLEILPGGGIRSFPIKGTRPRGATPAEDRRLQEELEQSPKERAELLMIVDLIRNDLGRVCETGSIGVPRLHALESFATVHHLVAEVAGRLRPGLRFSELLRAVFPGGSITGAPKVAALSLIDRLEPFRRGIFSGATGYISVHGRTDLAIAIRTIVCAKGEAWFHAGAGIVWDSDPAREYDETYEKVRALFGALGARNDPDTATCRASVLQTPNPRAMSEASARQTPYKAGGLSRIVDGELLPAPPSGMDELPWGRTGVFETLRFAGGKPVDWEPHWTRLVAGLKWMGAVSPVSEAEMRATSETLARENGIGTGVLRIAVVQGSATGPYMSDPVGADLMAARPFHWRIEAGPPRASAAKSSFRACWRSIDSRAGEPSHLKHLGRGAWAAARRSALAEGWDEAILVDQTGRLVEACASNLFLVRDGIIRTPPLCDGPLPGVTRARAIEAARAAGIEVREETCTREDLEKATEAWLTNSLIGVRPLEAVEGKALEVDGEVLRRVRRALCP